jgi:hypothetical protein
VDAAVLNLRAMAINFNCVIALLVKTGLPGPLPISILNDAAGSGVTA